MKRSVYIVGCGVLSPLGASVRESQSAHAQGHCATLPRRIAGHVHPVGALCAHAERDLSLLLKEQDGRYEALDRAVRLGVLAARQAMAAADFSRRQSPVGVIVASSRGATETLERSHAEFLETGRTRALASPTTTLGCLSSSIARELRVSDVAETVSSTCTGSLHALLLGVAWLRSGLGDACLVGGAEAPLTPFTLAQFAALGLLARDNVSPPACRPLSRETKTGLVLGEGACILAIESLSRRGAELRGALAEVSGIGTAIENAGSLTGITKQGDALASAMTRALREHGGSVDAVVVHAPGTKNGDSAELAALGRVFGAHQPALCSHKWQIGHTFGAAGALGVEFGLALLAGLRPAEPPYASALSAPPRDVRSVMVNVAGFGGAATSVVLRRMH